MLIILYYLEKIQLSYYRHRIKLKGSQCDIKWIDISEDIQSGQIDIRPDIKQWLDDNNMKYKFLNFRKELCFLKKNDAIMFQLNWAE